jgi:hypothetical protein
MVEMDLTVAAEMLLSSLLVLVRDHKVIHNLFLRKQLKIRNVVEVRTYNCGLLVFHVGLNLLDALLASEVNESVSHFQALLFWGAAILQNFVPALVGLFWSLLWFKFSLTFVRLEVWLVKPKALIPIFSPSVRVAELWTVRVRDWALTAASSSFARQSSHSGS